MYVIFRFFHLSIIQQIFTEHILGPMYYSRDDRYNRGQNKQKFYLQGGFCSRGGGCEISQVSEENMAGKLVISAMGKNKTKRLGSTGRGLKTLMGRTLKTLM